MEKCLWYHVLCKQVCPYSLLFPACVFSYVFADSSSNTDKSCCNFLATGCLGGLGNFQLMVMLEMSPRQGILCWLGISVSSFKKAKRDKTLPFWLPYTLGLSAGLRVSSNTLVWRNSSFTCKIWAELGSSFLNHPWLNTVSISYLYWISNNC